MGISSCLGRLLPNGARGVYPSCRAVRVLTIDTNRPTPRCSGRRAWTAQQVLSSRKLRAAAGIAHRPLLPVQDGVRAAERATPWAREGRARSGGAGQAVAAQWLSQWLHMQRRSRSVSWPGQQRRRRQCSAVVGPVFRLLRFEDQSLRNI